jgi:hypothetical protein
LSKFKFEPCSKTENPIVIDTVNLIHAPKGQVWFNIATV